MFRVEIRKRKGEKLGIRISSQQEFSERGKVLITGILPGSSAERCKQLAVGDEIVDITFDSKELTIRGEHFLSKNYDECYEMIDQIDFGIVYLTIRRLSDSQRYYMDTQNRLNTSSRLGSFGKMSDNGKVKRILPDLPADDPDTMILDGKQEEIVFGIRPSQKLMEEADLDLNTLAEFIDSEIFGDDSKSHMFSQIITDDELLDLPLITAGGKTTAYFGRRLEEKTEKFKNKMTSGELLEGFKTLRLENEVETQHGGTMRHNLLRNRYPNVLPYDSTRVILKNEFHDYINASHVRLTLGSEPLEDSVDSQKDKVSKVWFIAAQTPLLNTVADFWTMIWQQRVLTIISLTPPVEKEEINCIQFWPGETGSAASYGEHKVELEYAQELDTFNIYKLNLHSYLTGSNRKVLLLLLTNWTRDGESDVSLPYSPDSFIRFCNYSMMNFHDTSPLLVTCNDAISRSALFIAVFHLIKCIQNDIEVEIEAIVSQMREWRPNMLHNPELFKFLSTCYYRMLESLKI